MENLVDKKQLHILLFKQLHVFMVEQGFILENYNNNSEIFIVYVSTFYPDDLSQVNIKLIAISTSKNKIVDFVNK